MPSLSKLSRVLKRLSRPVFSLRTLIVFITLVALACIYVNRAETQRRCFNRSTRNNTASEKVIVELSELPGWLNWIPEPVKDFRGGHYARSIERMEVWGTIDGKESNWENIQSLLPACREIRFWNVTFRAQHIEELKYAKSLERLSLWHTKVGDGTTVQFPVLPRLQELTVIGLPDLQKGFLTAHLGNLSGSKDLRSVEIEHGTHVLIDQLANIESLEKCRFGRFCRISDEAIQELSRLPNLKELFVASPLSDKAARAISAMKSLEVLELKDSMITDDGIRGLATLPNLRVLNLDSCLASPNVGVLLKASTNLESLSLWSVKINKASADAIASLPSLKTLTIASQYLSSESLSKISELDLIFRCWSWKNGDGRLDRDEQTLCEKLTTRPIAVFANLSQFLPRNLKEQIRDLDIKVGDLEVAEAVELDLSSSDISAEELETLGLFKDVAPRQSNGAT